MIRSHSIPASLIVTVLVGGMMAVANADCANPTTFVWFSTSSSGADFAEVPLVNSTSSTTLHLWARLDPEEVVTDLSLNVVSSSAVELTAATFDNPALGEEAGVPVRRYENAPAPSIDSHLVRLQGFTLLNQATIGRGWGHPVSASDPLFDDEANAWRIGSVTFSASAAGDLSLQIGENGIQGRNAQAEVTPDFGVIFGDLNDPGLCALSERNVSSSTVDASVAHGTLRFDSPTSTTGPYTQSEDARLELTLGGDDGPVWQIQKNATLGGELDILRNGYLDPTVVGTQDVVPLISAAAIDGVFESVSFDGQMLFEATDQATQRVHVGNGLFRSLAYTEDTLTLTNHLALPGDFDLNQEVAFADFLILSGNFGGLGDWTEGDADGDGDIAFGDFLILSQWFGTQAPSVAKAVPESVTAWGMASLAGIFGLQIRRRR